MPMASLIASIRKAIGLAALLSLSACITSGASGGGGGSLGNAARPPAAGGYLESCREASQRGDVLQATCSAPGGGQVQNHRELALDTSRCRDEIRNMNGYLTCSAGDAAPPKGSWYGSCRNGVTAGNTLTALCQGPNGRWAETRLQGFAACGSDIANQDGRLVCRP